MDNFAMNENAKAFKYTNDIVISTFKIELKDFPGAFNPSIVKAPDGFILTFRYIPDPAFQSWISYIGVVYLDNSFQPLSEPQLLNSRLNNSCGHSQAEDARIFSYKGDFYLIYNDNPEGINPSGTNRRDLYLAKLTYSENGFHLSTPLKLFHPGYYSNVKWEKNWTPFIADETLFLSYSINPHEILVPDLETGESLPLYSTSANIFWEWGQLRGGTPALLVDGEYLAFFHSSKKLSTSPGNKLKHHYMMGAYTFSADPPYNIIKTSPAPIIYKDFYENTQAPKKVIYPGGYVVLDSNIYLSYGKNDEEIWIAVIDKNQLLKSLRSLKTEKKRR